MSQLKKDGVIYGIYLFFNATPDNLVYELKKDIINRLQKGQTPLDLLHYFFGLQAEDPLTWGPQPCSYLVINLPLR